jgi:hypothetical protein
MTSPFVFKVATTVEAAGLKKDRGDPGICPLPTSSAISDAGYRLKTSN